MLPFDKLLPTDKTSAQPVYQQIANAMIRHIQSGLFTPGMALPGTRELAGLLNLHRKTAIAAYDELAAQGWITAIPRKGFNVTHILPEVKPRRWAQKPQDLSFREKMAAPFYILHKTGFPAPALLPIPPRLIIDDGHPDDRLAPIDLLGREYRGRLKSAAVRRQVSASLVAGSPRLREALVSWLAGTRGLQAQVSNILVTHGAQMSIYIAANLLLKAGDAVIVAEPGYFVANEVFHHLGANILRVPIDEHGIDVDRVEKLCRQHPTRMLYVIPHHHHPTTVTLSPERRMRLLELAEKFNFAIVEDDYDYDFHYSSSPYLPLASGNHGNRVVYIGSFSKSLSRSIRVGFMVGPEDFTAQAVYLRRLIELKGDNNMEDTLAALILNGDISRHLKKVNKIYETRRNHLCQLLDTRLSGIVSYRKPSGGMAIWTSFAPHIPLPDLTAKALRQGLYLSDTRLYNTHQTNYNATRIGFASLSEPEMEEAIDILAHCAQ